MRECDRRNLTLALQIQFGPIVVRDWRPVHAETVSRLPIPLGGRRWQALVGSRAHCAVPESTRCGDNGKGDAMEGRQEKGGI